MELTAYNGSTYTARYIGFRVADAADKYRLEYDSWDRENSTVGIYDALKNSKGQQFSTVDQDNDRSERNCSGERGGGGWWYGECGSSWLTGINHYEETLSTGTGILWVHRPAILPVGAVGSWAAAIMKIRNNKRTRIKIQHSAVTARAPLTWQITDQLSFSISWEGLVSCGLVQLPGLALAILGIARAFNIHGCSCQGLEDAFLASFLAFFPFFLVELISMFSFLMSAIVHTFCSLMFKRGVGACAIKFDLLHFLMKKDKRPKAKILALDSTKVFFGSSFQFIFQLYLMRSTDIANLTQYLSIFFSFLMICKTAFQVYFYERKENEENDDRKGFFRNVLKELEQISVEMWAFLLALPLLGSNILSNFGSFHYMAHFFGVYSILGIFLLFLSNLITLFCLEIGNSEKSAIMRKLFISYTNMFFLSRPLDATKESTYRQVKLIQKIRFFNNSVFMIFFLIWMTKDKQRLNFEDFISPTIILCSGFFNIFILCKTKTNGEN